MGDPELTLPVPHGATLGELLHAAGEASTRGIAAVVATVLARRGSTPATPGQKLLLDASGRCLGTVGGGALEREVLTAMVSLLASLDDGSTTPRDAIGPRTVSFNLGAGLGMCCGGGVEILLEPIAPPARVLLVGAGHVATRVGPLLHGLGFVVTVCDEREAWSEAARFGEGIEVVTGSYREAGAALPRRTAVLVMTHDHGLDQDAIEWAIRAGFAFVGGVGSRAKIAKTRARLEARGFAADAIAKVRMPLGVAIGARTPEEIAVAIAAEMVAWRRGIAVTAIERTVPVRVRAGDGVVPPSGRDA